MFYPIKGGVIEIDDEDLPFISMFSWFMDKDGYAVTNVSPGTIEQKGIKLHRLIMDFPNDFIDHINREPLDNRKSNLRIVSHRENHNNRGDHGLWPPGVSYEKRYKYFFGRIWINGKSKYLGKSIDPLTLGIMYNSIKEELEQ